MKRSLLFIPVLLFAALALMLFRGLGRDAGSDRVR